MGDDDTPKGKRGRASGKNDAKGEKKNPGENTDSRKKRILLGTSAIISMTKQISIFMNFKEMYSENFNPDCDTEEILCFRAMIEYLMTNLEVFLKKNGLHDANRVFFFVFLVIYVIILPNLLEPFTLMYTPDELLCDFLFMKPEIFKMDFNKFRYISNQGTYATYFEYLGSHFFALK
jgi:hypothetical protein